VVSGNTRAAKTEEGVGPRWTEAALAAGVDSMTHYLTGTRQRLRDEGFEAHTLVMRGNAAEMLLSAGESTHSDLIVMSTHGRSGWQRLWMGSVAMKVVQGACCPVLLVRPRQAQG
jgi:nucleotide-binding universal stress UspA family protein